MKKNKKLCSYCSLPSVKYKCLRCDCTGKIENYGNFKFRFDDEEENSFSTISITHETCFQCQGKGWVLMPPIISEMYPQNVIEDEETPF